jgi:hypothetical protein
MTTTPKIIAEAEDLVRQLAAELTRVRAGECLCCYVARQLDEYPCDGTLRHALRFRDAVAPRATALAKRLGRVGGYCDCEVFLNGYTPHHRFWTPRREARGDDGFTYIVDAQAPNPLPPCAGVRRGAVEPCNNWVRLRRW